MMKKQLVAVGVRGERELGGKGKGKGKGKGRLVAVLLVILLLEYLPSGYGAVSSSSHFSSSSSGHEGSTTPYDDNMGAFKYKIIRRASTFRGSPRSSGGGDGKASSSPPPSSSSSSYGYDYIIVGGGTAGCPLAATLSEKYKVLLLERGGVPFHNPNVSDMANFHINLADLSSTSASQYFVSTDGVFNSRARVLGGGTCINAGFYTRASSSYVRSVGWDQELVDQSYPWVEERIVRLPKLAPWQRAVRDGLLEAGISPFNGYTYDHKYGTKVGGTLFEEDGRRRTAAELLASGNPNNLKVLVHATVLKILFDGGDDDDNNNNSTSTQQAKVNPKAVGVEFKDELGNLHRAYLSLSGTAAARDQSEIIVSSGAIGSPQMLLLSGIGPKADLEKLNVSVVLDNPFVGKDMADNPLNTVFIPTDKPVEQSLIQTVGITKKGVYIESSSGFGSSDDSIIRCHHGIASAEIGQLSTIPPRHRTVEAIQAYMQRKKDLPYEVFRGGFILEKIAKPKSRGDLHLLTTNPQDNPSVTFNYFSHPEDLKRCVEGVRIIEKVVKSKLFSGEYSSSLSFQRILNASTAASVNLIPRHTNDTTSLEQFCKDTVITIWHYHGGCHVGKVVDRDYRVLRVDRLRVIDGSTFYESPGTNPQATVMMLGRYMGLKILRERGHKS